MFRLFIILIFRGKLSVRFLLLALPFIIVSVRIHVCSFFLSFSALATTLDVWVCHSYNLTFFYIWHKWITEVSGFVHCALSVKQKLYHRSRRENRALIRGVHQHHDKNRSRANKRHLHVAKVVCVYMVYVVYGVGKEESVQINTLNEKAKTTAKKNW